MAVTATMLTAPLAAQTPVKAEMQVGNIEQRSASLHDYRPDKPEVQLRADSKALLEYSITYTSSGRDSSKTVYEYNAAGKTTSHTNYDWKNNDWVNSSKSVSEYNAAGNETLYTYYEWKNNSWVNSSKTVYEYDAAGNRTLYERYEWKNNSWVNISKTVTEYTGGEQSKRLSYTWENNGWKLSSTMVGPGMDVRPSYYISGDVMQFGIPYGNGYFYFTFDYDATTKYEAKHDAKGYLISFKYEDYAEFQIKYNSDNNVVSVEEIWSGNLAYKSTYEYDNNGNRVLFERNRWDGSKGGYRSVNTYDEQGRLTLSESYDTDYEKDIWVLSSSNERQYDANGNVIYYSYYSTSYGSECSIHKFDDNGNRLSSHYYDIVDDERVLTYYIIYYYEKEVSNESITSAQSTAYLYGNTLYITTSQVEQVAIYSISGSKLYETTVSAGTTTIDAGAFPQGILIVKGNGWSVKVKK